MATDEEYLGDGLFASFDGHQIRLRAPRGPAGDHEVFLDATTLGAFESYVVRLKEQIRRIHHEHSLHRT